MVHLASLLTVGLLASAAVASSSSSHASRQSNEKRLRGGKSKRASCKARDAAMLAAAAPSEPATAQAKVLDTSVAVTIEIDPFAGMFGPTTTILPPGLQPTATTTGVAVPTITSTTGGNATNLNKHVFAHFMIGITSTYVQQDYVNDMNLAMSKGITGFALNIGTDPYTQQQLDYAYAAAAQVGFNVFISFDFNWYNLADVASVVTLLSRYKSQPAQLLVENKMFVSTFIGDGFDWGSAASQAGVELYAVPYWQPSATYADDQALEGLFSWSVSSRDLSSAQTDVFRLAWPGQPNNIPVKQNLTTLVDMEYINMTAAVSKQYMAPVSPHFFTHFGKEVSYSKNFMFYTETLWHYRWEQILQMGSQNNLNFVEIITWNDYGESHYVGPVNTPHTDDGSSRWTSGFDHTPFLDFAVPYIDAFKRGASAPNITQDLMTFWYRPTLRDVSCNATDNCGGPPTGYEFVDDVVFVATMLTEPASITVTSGSNAAVTQTVEAGVQMLSVPMGVGTQQFSIVTNSGKKGSATPNITVSDECWNGIYNYNYNSGSIVPI